MYVKTRTHLQTVQKYMSIMLIALPHMEEFMIVAATKKYLFWIQEHYFVKFHETYETLLPR